MQNDKRAMKAINTRLCKDGDSHPQVKGKLKKTVHRVVRRKLKHETDQAARDE